jgi:hypothetical protein
VIEFLGEFTKFQDRPALSVGDLSGFVSFVRQFRPLFRSEV